MTQTPIMDEPFEMLADAESVIATLLAALEKLVENYDHYARSEGEMSDAYYCLVKGRHLDWEAARSAIHTARTWDVDQ